MTTDTEAMAARDPEAEGMFVVAVRTTGVFCRPTCASRTPLRKNVEFHSTGSGMPWSPAFARVADGDRPMGTRLPSAELIVTRLETPIGPMIAAAVNDGIAVLDFADRRATRTALRNASGTARGAADHRPATHTSTRLRVS